MTILKEHEFSNENPCLNNIGMSCKMSHEHFFYIYDFALEKKKTTIWTPQDMQSIKTLFKTFWNLRKYMKLYFLSSSQYMLCKST
jgi:hypothetical protein